MTEEYENYEDMEEMARRVMERWEQERADKPADVEPTERPATESTDRSPRPA